jgi:uncharacterized protein (DUF488 family)
MNPIYTISHSNHDWETFYALLKEHEIQRLVDVRSRPVSRHAPFANKRRLPALCEEAAIDYVFLSKKLGARPLNKEMYDRGGTPDYGKIGSTPQYAEGIEELLVLSEGLTTVIMCAEEDHSNCHRTVLIGPRLSERGVEQRHIRKDGRVEVSMV